MSKKVLVVDDDREIVSLVSELLSDNYDVETAFSGQEALAQIQHSRPDILITDAWMPTMSGPELIKILKSQSLAIPTILISGHESYTRGLKQGSLADADVFIAKPFNGETLHDTCQKLLLAARVLTR